MAQFEQPKRGTRVRTLREKPSASIERRPRTLTRGKDVPRAEFDNAMSHRILVEKARSAPKMKPGKISESSRIVIEGTMVLLEKALRRLADK